MWLLAAEDRLYWLLPNKRYTVGRAASNNEKSIDIALHNDTSVSRKHLTLQVLHPTAEAVLHPSIRSDLLVTDLNSRYGTRVEGKLVPTGTSITVPQVPNGMLSIKLGREATKLRLRWSLYVVTYLTGQDGEAHETLFQHAFKVAQRCDIRLTSHLVSATDVIVVTGKATSSLYYALCKQIPVVNTQYLEALKEAAEKNSANGTLGSSVLPKLDSFYADPSYKPDPKREKLLDGYEIRIPDANYEQVMKPIVLATGGTVSDTAPVLLVNSNDDPHLIANSKYILGNTLFAIITDARQLNSNDISTFKKHVQRKQDLAKRPRKGNLLDIMTSQEIPQDEPENKRRKVVPDTEKYTKPVRKTKHERRNLLDIMTSQEPEHEPEGEPIQEPAQENPAQNSPENGHVHKEVTQSKVETKRQSNEVNNLTVTQRETTSAKKRQNTPGNAGKVQKKAKASNSGESLEKNRTTAEQDLKEKSEPVDTEWNFSDLADLVTITDEVPVKRRIRHAKTSSSGNTSTPNFKGFRHKGEKGSRAYVPPQRQRRSIQMTSGDSSTTAQSADLGDTPNNDPAVANSASRAQYPAARSRHDMLSKALGPQDIVEDDEFAFSFS